MSGYCTLDTAAGDIWCGVVTVAALDTATDGFHGATGGLSDTTFSVGTGNYTIEQVTVDNSTSTSPGALLFGLTRVLTAADRAKLVLHVDGSSDTFAFSAATLFGGGGTDSYVWGTALDWSSATTVTLRLREDPDAIDASLSALTVTHPGGSVALRPTFAPETEEYRASVANAVGEVTVAAEAAVAEATLAYLDGDGTAIADADTGTPGREVALEAGEETLVQVKVTAANGDAMRTYRVRVTHRVHMDPAICGGRPHIRGTRVRVSDSTAPSPPSPPPGHCMIQGSNVGLRLRLIRPTQLGKRMEQFGLRLHPEKTRLIAFERPEAGQRSGKGPGTFDFLGFTMYWRRTRRGRWQMWCKKRSKGLRRFNRMVSEWCRRHRHLPVEVQHAALTRRLVGHFNYVGVNGNARSMMRVRQATIRAWFKWLRRRSQRTRLTWERFGRLLERFPLPRPRVVVRIWGG